jgi:putative Holliday junction resolvase
VYDGFEIKIRRKRRQTSMKIMAIDYGDAHTGIAISDFTCTLAGYTTVINSRKAEVVVQEIQKIIAEIEV